MATSAAAQESFFALRREIARIEGRLAGRLEETAPLPQSGAVLVRRNGNSVAGEGLLATGAGAFDRALGGGLPQAALTEIQGAETRDAGTVDGLRPGAGQPACRKSPGAGPVDRDLRRLPGSRAALCARAAIALWHRARPSARRSRRQGSPMRCGSPRRPPGWAGSRRCSSKSAAIPRGFDLTATRRLHRRARDAGRPVFLLRQAGLPEPTAAPVRLVVSPAPAGPRQTVRRAACRLDRATRLPGRPQQEPSAPAAQFTLEWNVHERAFQERGAENPVAVAPLPRRRTAYCGKVWVGPGVPVPGRASRSCSAGRKAIRAASPPWMNRPSVSA